MRQSQLFTKTRKEDPKDEVAKNAKLLIRGGFINKELAGVYSYLPLGLRVLNKINNIIREEMNGLGAVELELTALQNPELYEKTNRWAEEAVDVWFKTNLKSGSQLGLGFTHEEAITELMKDHVSSYKDLPVYAYQIQTKFRNEERAKSGLMRGREFLMKDLYSFNDSEESLNDFYDQVKGAYERIYERVGLGDLTYITFASGGSFSKFSHEFQTLSEAGEDTIYVCEEKKFAINKEVLDEETLKEVGIARENLVEKKAIEVGNIFKLGTRFSEPLGLTFTDENGEKRPVVMGSYGIGPGRLMGTVVETLSDEKGIVWPKSIAPFDLHLVWIPGEGDLAAELADKLYDGLTEEGIEVFYDDQVTSAGEKFANADLLGLPYRVIVSDKTLKEGKFELTERATRETRWVDEEELFALLK
ncbi:MAG: aminoacyl--tRNA ligase-related protein [Candidatus Paceibacterota bacterium]|jgi:prolyl-tRNA synthetase